MRWLVYTTLAYGGKGISYFLYWGPKAYGGLYQDGVRTPLALDVAALVAVGGCFVAAAGWLVRRQALVPLRDPRLAESLAFENA